MNGDCDISFFDVWCFFLFLFFLRGSPSLNISLCPTNFQWPRVYKNLFFATQIKIAQKNMSLCVSDFSIKSCAHSNWNLCRIFFHSLSLVRRASRNISTFIDGKQITVKHTASHKLCLPFNEMLLLIYL